MKKIISLALVLLLVGSVLFSTPVIANANTTINGNCTYYNYDNIGDYDYYWNWSNPIYSYLSTCNDGGLMRFQAIHSYDGLVMFAEYFDSNFNFIRHVPIQNELQLFGGFYSDGNNYYVLSGQENPNEDNAAEVFRLTKYDLNWNRISACSITDDNTTIPFNAGTPRFTHSGNQLLIRTDHEMYMSSDGKNHQANVTLQINTSDMSLVSKRTCVLNTGFGYSSHSFNQFIKLDGNKIVAADHGDAYPRTLALFIYEKNLSSAGLGDYPTTQCLSFLDIPGEVGANYTGCTMGGFEVSNSNYIIAGTKINLNDFENSTTENVFISYIPKNSTTATVKMLTSYAEGDSSASTPHFVKLSGNKFMVLWEKNNKTHYILINETGDKLSSEITVDARLSDCPPVIYNNQLVWYTQSYDILTFNKIDLNDISNFQKKDIKYGCEFTLKSISGNSANFECGKCKKTTTEVIPAISIDLYNNEAYSYSGTCHLGYDYNFYFFLNEDYRSYQVVSCSQDTAKIKLTNRADTIFYEFTIKIADPTIAKFSTKNSNSLMVTPLNYGKTKLIITSAISDKVKSELEFEGGCIACSQSTTYPTCKREGKRVSVCGICDREWTEILPKTAHVEETLHGYSPTCTQTGLTDGAKCSVCGTVTVAQKEIAKLAHNQNTKITGKAATCTATGLTDGAKCSVCGKVTVEQKEIAKIAHNSNTKLTGKAATCTATGLTDGAKCSVCGTVTVAQKEIAKKAHNSSVILPRVEPTLTSTGLTQGAKCSVCGTVTVPQQVIPKLELSAPVITSLASTTGGVKFTWTAVPNAVKYKVYRKTYHPSTGTWDSKWKKINKVEVKGTEYVDGTAKLGTQYMYLIKAVNGKATKNSAASPAVVFKISPTPTAYLKSNGIKVKWPETVVSAESYRIYRAEYNENTKKYNSYKKVKTVKGTTKSWTDTTVVSGKKYKYCVKAVRGKVVCDKVQTKSMYFLTKPTATAANTGNGIAVNWSWVQGATSFKIYRASLQNGAWTGYSHIATVGATTSYLDSATVPGAQYKYKVKAVKSKTGQTSSATAAVIR